jgi:hypothetical protein
MQTPTHFVEAPHQKIATCVCVCGACIIYIYIIIQRTSPCMYANTYTYTEELRKQMVVKARPIPSSVYQANFEVQRSTVCDPPQTGVPLLTRLRLVYHC